MRANLTSKRSLFVVTCLVLASGCGQELDVGSDILWTSRFEGGTFDEWTSVGGSDSASPGDVIEISSEYAHQGKFAAKLTVTAPSDNSQGNGAGLARQGNLPVQAYYSAWYYLPSNVTVGIYWVIMKFRLRSVADDPATEDELFDVNLKNLPSGDMSLRLYDHRAGDLPLAVADPQVPVGHWFQIEAFYRDDATAGQLTLWLSGNKILDWQGPTGPTPWVAWDVVSVGDSLNPATAILYVDDCAVSQSRVGFTGQIAE
jgi:hypothetical protein